MPPEKAMPQRATRRELTLAAEVRALRRQLDEARHQAELERLTVLGLSSAGPDRVLLLKPDGTIILVNQALATALGKSNAELAGTNVRSHFSRRLGVCPSNP
jgi:PAS domain-containing protein